MPHDTQSLASFPTSHAAGLELLAAGPRLPRLDLRFGATLPHRVQRPMVLLGQKKKGNKWSVAVWDTNGIMVRLEMLAPNLIQIPWMEWIEVYFPYKSENTYPISSCGKSSLKSWHHKLWWSILICSERANLRVRFRTHLHITVCHYNAVIP